MATVALDNGIVGQLRASEISRDRVEDARTVLKVGETVEAKFTGVDRKTRVLSLSIKAKEAHEEQQALQNYKTDAGRPTTGTTLGDLLKEKMTPE
jgi:small subunit ribosomal protein S1